MNKSIKPSMCELSSFKSDCLIWDPKALNKHLLKLSTCTSMFDGRDFLRCKVTLLKQKQMK